MPYYNWSGWYSFQAHLLISNYICHNIPLQLKKMGMATFILFFFKWLSWKYENSNWLLIQSSWSPDCCLPHAYEFRPHSLFTHRSLSHSIHNFLYMHMYVGISALMSTELSWQIWCTKELEVKPTLSYICLFDYQCSRVASNFMYTHVFSCFETVQPLFGMLTFLEF